MQHIRNLKPSIGHLVITSAALLASQLMSIGSCDASPKYTITDLNQIGSVGSDATAINNRGDVVGLQTVYAPAPFQDGKIHRAYVWKPLVKNGAKGSYTILDPSWNDFNLRPNAARLQNQAAQFKSAVVSRIDRQHVNDVSPLLLTGMPISASATAISNADEVVGFAQKGSSGVHSFINSQSKAPDIKSIGGNLCMAYGVNNAEQIVGYSSISEQSSVKHAFLWQNGSILDLGTLGGGDSSALAINDHREVVGFAYNGQKRDSEYHAFLWKSGTMQYLGTLGGKYSVARSINLEGDIVGQSTIPGDAVIRHAFYWSNGKMTDLNPFGSNFSNANAINAHKEIVGQAELVNGKYHAFLVKDGVVIDLNDCLQASSGWQLVEATGINDAGQIVGKGIKDGAIHAFLLTPVSK